MDRCDEVTVLVCTIKKEPIDGTLRYSWMKELLPGALVVHVTDEVPSYPYEHSGFWEIWTALLKREIPANTEVFFSSEEYGEEVAERLGIHHELIDKERTQVPVSGSAIRSHPFDNWSFIPDVVKPYFVKRIVLTGPESTGKTTMAELLANEFDTNWVEEYGRNYFVERNGNLGLADISRIAEGQVALEEKALLSANKFLFCDTDVIVTQVWSEIYFKECPREVIDLSHSRKYDLYLLMDIDIPWEDDGTREFPHLREWHFNRLKLELENRNVNYLVVSGTIAERLEFIKEHLFKL